MRDDTNSRKNQLDASRESATGHSPHDTGPGLTDEVGEKSSRMRSDLPNAPIDAQISGAANECLISLAEFQRSAALSSSLLLVLLDSGAIKLTLSPEGLPLIDIASPLTAAGLQHAQVVRQTVATEENALVVDRIAALLEHELPALVEEALQSISIAAAPQQATPLASLREGKAS